MNYQQALDYIYSFADQGFKAKGQAYSLTRMRTLLAQLGDPHLKIPGVHVAGTKGKGSTSALVASILQVAGYRVGLYTSPHLNETYERLRINGVPITAEGLAALTTELRPLFDSFAGITTFEILTALAFVWCRREHCTFMVIETGLGGRLDATNVVMPNVCAITSISYDHVKQLGNTLGEIASHKAGIIKGGAPVVVAPQSPEAAEVFAATARAQGSHLITVGSTWRYHRESFDRQGQTFRLQQEATQTESLFQLPLLGAHQIENAATAVACAYELRVQGFKISDEALYTGVAQVRWAGRFEVLGNVILDCAHNRDSMQHLVQTFQELYTDCAPSIIFGASDDKDVDGMLEELRALQGELILVKASHPRASDPTRIRMRAEVLRVARSIKVAHTILHALETAQQVAPCTLVTGSIFVVAEARAQLLS